MSLDPVRVAITTLKPGVRIPAYQSDGAAGMDLEAAIDDAVAIPAGEARYVLDRLTGQTSLKKGPTMYLADPRREEMKEIVNTKIKFREPFRPFAPVVLEERAAEYFTRNRSSSVTFSPSWRRWWPCRF